MPGRISYLSRHISRACAVENRAYRGKSYRAYRVENNRTPFGRRALEARPFARARLKTAPTGWNLLPISPAFASGASCSSTTSVAAIFPGPFSLFPPLGALVSHIFLDFAPVFG